MKSATGTARKKTSASKKQTPAAAVKAAPAKAVTDKAAAYKGTKTLAIDIGGTGLKAALLDENGEMLTERVRVETPADRGPQMIVDTLAKLVAPLKGYSRVSVGFPGVVRKGIVLTAHNLGTEVWRGFNIDEALTSRLGKPVRVLNDADVQGLGAIKGDGVEVVITLGTGLGSSIFEDGLIATHLELAHHPFRKGQTYEEQLGNVALKKVGKKEWNKRVQKAISALRTLTTFDHMYIGGGNAKAIKFTLPPDVSIVPNELGMRGGIWLWKDRAVNRGIASKTGK